MTKIITNLHTRARHFAKTNPTIVNYGIDGILVLGAMNIAVNNNNLFAMRLGATSVQLSLLHLFPSLLGLILLIPAGFFADSLKNKRHMITAMLLVTGFFFLIVSTSAFVPIHTVYFFLIFVALATVSTNGLYNLAWLAFFPEVVPEEERNNVLTFRARMTMLVALVAPLMVGAVLAAVPSEGGKIITHQIFYVIVALLFVANAFHFRKIKAILPAKPQRITRTEMKLAVKGLISNKKFVVFTLAVLFFHATWHFDWTLYFIGQYRYLQMNEFMLMLAPITTTFAQLLTLKFWSKLNTKIGVDKPLTFGILGLSLNPIAMIVGTSLPAPIGMYVFVVLHFIAMLTFAIVLLNVFQCLLNVIGEEYRSFTIALYSCLIMLSNALMPRIGVGIYTMLGENLSALRWTFVIAFGLRLVAAGVWWLRCRYAIVQGK